MSIYNVYLQSEHWKNFRNETLKKRNKCEKCNSKENLCLHHLTYERLGHETQEDIMVLCNDCHKKIHSERKTPKRRAGNQKTYVKLYLTKLSELVVLPDKDLGSVLRMARLIDWDTGVLVDVRTKEPLDYKGLCKQLKYTEQTLNNRLKVLKDKDVLTKDEEGYKINSEYISKG